MNILAISNFFAELFADGGLYLCLLAAMGAVTVLFVIIALLVPKKLIKKDGKIKKKSKQNKQAEQQTAGVHPDAMKEVYDDEQVPTVKQVLGETAEEFDYDEPVIEAESISGGLGRTEPVLTFEQIISEAKEKTPDKTPEKIRRVDKAKVK